MSHSSSNISIASSAYTANPDGSPKDLPRLAGYPWIPDRGDGNYANPVIHADYSDLDVIRVGEDFWMTASSFNCTPGLPILHSPDLVNWTLVNHAIRNVPHLSYAEMRAGCGVWAPAIRYHADKFWIFFPTPDEGIFVTCADDPRGRWEEPWCLQEAKGWIDPCPFWDDDGQAYLVHAFANSRAGKHSRLHLRPMTPDCRSLLGEGRELVHTPHHPYLEGPKMHKFDGLYYILAPGGGVKNGWQVVFRSPNIWGPYEEKVVLEQGSTQINGPHQGALVDAPDGSWWFIHFQDADAFGRIAHVQPTRWVDGWPLMGVDLDGNGIGEPVSVWKKPVSGFDPAIPATTDEFESPELGLQWQWNANHDPRWASLSARPGWLRLHGSPIADLEIGVSPRFLGQKFPARGFALETCVEWSAPESGDGTAGLAIVGGGKSFAVGLSRSGTAMAIITRSPEGILEHAQVTGNTAYLRVSVDADASLQFSWSPDGSAFTPVGNRQSVTDGGWLGARVGLFHSPAAAPSSPEQTAFADFSYFRFAPRN